MDLDQFVQDAKTRVGRLQRPFEGCDNLERVITELLPVSLTGVASSTARAALSILFAKALKSFNGVRILAAFGHGEDALIVSRSLLNLSFVAGYICARNGNPEERASAWMANGYLAQRSFIEKDLGISLSDDLAKSVDWESVGKHAGGKLWPKNVSHLAQGAGMEELYKQAYRFMSAPEHSDAWGVNTYIRAWDETGLHLNVNPSDSRVSLSLEIAAQATANVFVKFCEVFEIPYSVERIGHIGSYFGDGEEDQG